MSDVLPPETPERPDHRLSIAPMMDWTDRHCRYFLRQLSRRTVLYTEMIHTGAILHGDRQRLLGFHPDEHPLAIQLGGDDPRALAESAAIAVDWGYDEINLNVGCPSDKVQDGQFGACLMRRPERVAECVASMRARVRVPVTVKHRIGVDELDAYDDMARFVEIVGQGGCETFIVHARKAWLQGLNPKQNREVPPLRYADVYRLKREFPHLQIEINGGIRSLDQALLQLQQVDGVMIGRAAYEDPFLLVEADARIFGVTGATPPNRRAVLERLFPYVEAHLARGFPLKHISRHLLGLFHGVPGARLWKRTLSENAYKSTVGVELLMHALESVEQQQLELERQAGQAVDLHLEGAALPPPRFFFSDG